MKSTIKFNLRDLNLCGEWDETNKLALITEIKGDLGLEGKLLGVPVTLKGTVGAGMDNQLQVKVRSQGGLPNFFIPGILNLLKTVNRKFAKAASVHQDMILVDPNQLLPESSEIKILVQPNAIEISDDSMKTLRERIINWTEKNAGKIAKEIVDIIMTIPDLVILLINLARDPRIPKELKLRIALCIAYIFSPVDLIPEILAGPLGFTDDTVAVGFTISNLATTISPDIIRENWHGRPDVLELLIKGHSLISLNSGLPELVFKKLSLIFGKSKTKVAVAKS